MDFEKIIKTVANTRGIFNEMRSNLSVESKGASDYVTAVDLAVQEYIKGKLYELYPDIGFVSEEQEEHKFDGVNPVWILDPVDGTTNFIHDYDQYAVSLGLGIQNDAEFGVVYNPALDDLYYAIRGKGAYLNNKRMHVSNAEKLEESLVLFGSAPYYKERSGEVFDIAREFFLSCQDLRRSGSAALDIAAVASGKIDIYFEYNLKPWDYAAGMALIREAGGKMTNWEGSHAGLTKLTAVIVTNGKVHDMALGIVKDSALKTDTAGNSLDYSRV